MGDFDSIQRVKKRVRCVVAMRPASVLFSIVFGSEIATRCDVVQRHCRQQRAFSYWAAELRELPRLPHQRIDVVAAVGHYAVSYRFVILLLGLFGNRDS